MQSYNSYKKCPPCSLTTVTEKVLIMSSYNSNKKCPLCRVTIVIKSSTAKSYNSYKDSVHYEQLQQL